MPDPNNIAVALSKLNMHDSNDNTEGGISISTYPNIVTLDIGGRNFKVSRNILEAGSGLFRRQLSGRVAWQPGGDGCYFIDADPKIFEHLIRFMRRPNTFPLFYDQSKGFDYDLYNRLQAEAEYFQVDALSEWIRNKRYLEAVKVSTRADLLMITRTRKVYVCPRKIPVHRDAKEKCGQACFKAGSGEYEEETYVQVACLQKEIVFDEKACKVEKDGNE